MIRHRDVQKLLYEYVRGEIEPESRQQVHTHLANCTRCAHDLEEIKTVLHTLSAESDNPIHILPQNNWDDFHASIMQRVKAAGGRRFRFPLSTTLQQLLTGHPRRHYLLAGGLAVVVIALLLFLGAPLGTQESTAPPEKAQMPREDTREEEIGRYFRKSRALLVGLSNLDPPPGSPVDLTVERELSRQLVLEARELRGQKLDLRSSRLISDLDRIMEKVSSTGQIEIQTIRRDIRGQNLLMKLRVAESSHPGIPITKTRNDL